MMGGGGGGGGGGGSKPGSGRMRKDSLISFGASSAESLEAENEGIFFFLFILHGGPLDPLRGTPRGTPERGTPGGTPQGRVHDAVQRHLTSEMTCHKSDK